MIQPVVVAWWCLPPLCQELQCSGGEYAVPAGCRTARVYKQALRGSCLVEGRRSLVSRCGCQGGFAQADQAAKLTRVEAAKDTSASRAITLIVTNCSEAAKKSVQGVDIRCSIKEFAHLLARQCPG